MRLDQMFDKAEDLVGPSQIVNAEDFQGPATFQ